MEESLFAEFQYFIKRINTARKGGRLKGGETLEDLELRFRRQVENGLVIINPDAQELAMEILLDTEISEVQKRAHIRELRLSGSTDYATKNTGRIRREIAPSTDRDRERVLGWMVQALQRAGVRVQKQPLGIKMLIAAHEIGNVDYHDHGDIKLLFAKTIKLSGHAKKVDPVKLATLFNNILG